MTWVILIAFLGLVLFMSLVGRQQVAWAGKLRRVRAGGAQYREWMAPDEVVKRVQEDYLAAMLWLPESALRDWSVQWNEAELYFCGGQLSRHLEILKRQRIGQKPRYTGVMRCTHRVLVRHFSDDGERCLVLDAQSGRTIQTVDTKTGRVVSKQAMEPGTVVYQMQYDKRERRWKVEQYVQELPKGWTGQAGGNPANRVRLLAALPPKIGRDG